MRWTESDHRGAEQESEQYAAEFNEKWMAWKNAVQSGAPTAANNQAVVEEVVRRWRQNVALLRQKSDDIMSNENLMDDLGQLATQVADEKVTLHRLRGKAVTRGDQADSVNPKVRASPYTNLLGLNRVFRDSTRFSILIASIVFGVLSLGSLGYLVYRITASGALVPMGYQQSGGSTKRNK